MGGDDIPLHLFVSDMQVQPEGERKFHVNEPCRGMFLSGRVGLNSEGHDYCINGDRGTVGAVTSVMASAYCCQERIQPVVYANLYLPPNSVSPLISSTLFWAQKM